MARGRVAILAPFSPRITGGVSTLVRAQERRHRRQGRVVAIIAPEDVQAPPGSWSYLWRTHRRLARLRPHEIHAHGHWYTLAAALTWRYRNPPTRVAFHVHTEFRETAPGRRRLLALLLRRSDRVRCYSRFMADWLEREVGPLPNLLVRYPHLDLQVRGEPRRTVHDPLRLLAVDVMAYPEKTRVLAAALEDLARTSRGRSIQIRIAGDGPLRPLVTRAIARAASYTDFEVELLGRIPDLGVHREWADVFLHATGREALGLVLLEAQAAGLPIIASRVGGIPEVVTEGVNGELVTGTGWGDRLRKVSDPARYPGYSVASLETFRERFAAPPP